MKERYRFFWVCCGRPAPKPTRTASPAPMTHKTQQPPFLGCLLSVLSQSNLRYEGTLYVLDPSQETISLEKVRCLGSEGRLQRTEKPSAQVFEYVVHVLSHF